MSNQGNIEVWAWPPSTTNNENNGLFRFTTMRHGGDMTPIAVKRALIECYLEKDNLGEESWDPRYFLGALMHDPDVYHPISGFGNTDTPTVVVNFATQGVFFRKDWLPIPQRISGWSFAEYIKLNLKREKLILEHFENYADLREGAHDEPSAHCGRCGHTRGIRRV
jgi:hypothetical protein